METIGDTYMLIQILGTGCPKCKALEAHAKEAVAKGNIDATVEKVTNMDDIMEMGVMMTPALRIDGVVKSSGKLLSTDEILTLLRK